MDEHAAQGTQCPLAAHRRNDVKMKFEETQSMDAKRKQLLEAGVKMMDPSAVYVDDSVTVGAGTLLLPGTILRGNTQVGPNCEIGPYTHIRPHCVVGEGSKIGAFVQLKNCNLGEGTKMAHLTYVGDSDVGDHCNFGCGTVTCNYDGFKKFRTTIGDNVFVGCNTNFVPPVKVGDGAYIAAATTVTQDVPADAMVIGRARQQVKEGWAAANREKKGKK